MFGIVLLSRQSVDRFHLNLAGSLTTDFVVQCYDLLAFQNHGLK